MADRSRVTRHRRPRRAAAPAEAGRRRHGHAPIAIFISRKDSKIYVRQNFAPLLEAPVTIDHRDQPLGTHVYTAMEYLDRGTTFRWTVVSLPAEPPKAARNGRNEKRFAKGKHKHGGEAETTPVIDVAANAEEALGRITIPQDMVEQISQLIVPGSSLVISDQGLGPETGLRHRFHCCHALIGRGGQSLWHSSVCGKTAGRGPPLFHRRGAAGIQPPTLPVYVEQPQSGRPFGPRFLYTKEDHLGQAFLSGRFR